MRHLSHALGLPALILGVFMTMAGCSTEASGVPSAPVVLASSALSPQTSSPAQAGHMATSLVDLFQQYLDHPSLSQDGLSSLEVGILQDAVSQGTISTADYEEAHAAVEACYIQHGVDGVTWHKGADGVYHSSGADPSRSDFTESEWVAASNTCDSLMDAVDFLYTMQQSNPDLLSDQNEQAVDCLRRHGIVDASYTVAEFKESIQTMNAALFPFDVNGPDANACLAAAGYVFVQG